jgi:hypothetical protein
VAESMTIAQGKVSAEISIVPNGQIRCGDEQLTGLRGTGFRQTGQDGGQGRGRRTR